jgi:hypothetical protein
VLRTRNDRQRFAWVSPAMSTEDMSTDQHPLAWLTELAFRVAAADGDDSPAGAQYVLTTRRAAAGVTSGSWIEADEEAYLVVLCGSFVHTNYTGSPGSSAPRGTVIHFTVDPVTHHIYDYGIRDRTPDLSTLGRVDDLPLEAAE